MRTSFLAAARRTAPSNHCCLAVRGLAKAASTAAAMAGLFPFFAAAASAAARAAAVGSFCLVPTPPPKRLLSPPEAASELTARTAATDAIPAAMSMMPSGCQPWNLRKLPVPRGEYLDEDECFFSCSPEVEIVLFLKRKKESSKQASGKKRRKRSPPHTSSSRSSSSSPCGGRQGTPWAAAGRCRDPSRSTSPMRRSRSWRRFGRRAAASSPTTSSSLPACPAAARPRPSQRATSSSRANQRCSRAPARWSGKTRASRRTRRSPRREPSSSRSAEPRRRWARRRERRRASSGWGTATRTMNSRKAARGRSGTTRRGATGTCFYFFYSLFVCF